MHCHHPTPSSQHKEKNTHLWHRRLGHISLQRLRQLLTSGAVDGVQLRGIPSHTCTTCILGKHAKKKFPKEATFRASRPIQLVHTDLSGRISFPTFSGYEYFMTFIDDYSRYAVVRLIRHKSDAFELFRRYHVWAERQTGQKLSMIRSDHGGEYLSGEFDTYLAEHGIQRQLTTTYTPQQNGVAERKNRTLFDAARCLRKVIFIEEEFLQTVPTSVSEIASEEELQCDPSFFACPSINVQTPQPQTTSSTPPVTSTQSAPQPAPQPVPQSIPPVIPLQAPTQTPTVILISQPILTSVSQSLIPRRRQTPLSITIPAPPPIQHPSSSSQPTTSKVIFPDQLPEEDNEEGSAPFQDLPPTSPSRYIDSHSGLELMPHLGMHALSPRSSRLTPIQHDQMRRHSGSSSTPDPTQFLEEPFPDSPPHQQQDPRRSARSNKGVPPPRAVEENYDPTVLLPRQRKP
ncbi:hypothetical protein R1sor_006859 [Riccia sorocarpa]|uniref:Integrase catalytic domain-containing protein n=1 Tax=Riccia sorocarpa TaxID=122646 RepID=A0ABD3HP91_9MARC